jgi:sugar phosphate isomerase/epimerase
LNQPNRRQFLVACSAAGVSLAVEQGLPRVLKAESSERKIGIQLYTVAADLNTEPQKTLNALANIGYKQVETAGFAKLSAAEFRKALDDAGLKSPSAHLHFTDADPGPLFEDAHATGAHYVVSSVLIAPPTAVAGAPAANGMKAMMQQMANLNLDDYKRTAELANKIGAKAKAAGFQFAYHNHNFEFKDQGNGKIGYDVLLSQTDAELVKFELDCGWMIAAGHDPLEYFKKYPDRYRMIHVKDFMAGGKVSTSLAPEDRPQGTELGRGHIDYTKIFPAAEKAGVEYFFSEQEPPIAGMTALEAAKVNFDYMRGIK